MTWRSHGFPGASGQRGAVRVGLLMTVTRAIWSKLEVNMSLSAVEYWSKYWEYIFMASVMGGRSVVNSVATSRC